MRDYIWVGKTESKISRGVTDKELEEIVDLIIEINPKTILEIGTHQGRTTLNIEQFARKDAVIYTIDKENNLFDDYSYPENINFIISDSMDFDFNSLGMKFDFIFIDAGHYKEAVLNDTKKSLEVLEKGGIIVWHDYHPNKTPSKVQGYFGVAPAIEELGLEVELIAGTKLAFLKK